MNRVTLFISLWSPLVDGPMDGTQACHIAIPAHECTIAWARGWLDHYEKRIACERAMLDEQGGLRAEGQDIQPGGRVLIDNEWLIVVRVNKKDGKPVSDLTPYLGAMGHLVIMSQDLKEFVHRHPHEHAEGDHDHAKQVHTDMKGGPKVDFEAHFKAAGLYKGWAQFQLNSKVITVPFTFNVAKGEGSGEAKPHEDGK